MNEPRYVWVAMPSNTEADHLEDRIEQLQLTDQLGAGRFKRANWHQSLSDRYWPEEIPGLERKLIRACSALSAYTVTLTLNRVVREDGHCALYGDGTRDFRALLLAVKAALASQGIPSPATNKPHISLSYWGAEAGSEFQIAPIPWAIREVFIVKGQGRGDDYKVVASKALTSPPIGE